MSEISGKLGPPARRGEVTRRAALAVGLLPFAPAYAQTTPKKEDLAKLGCWIVGNKLGLASFMYFRFTGNWEPMYAEAKGTAKEIGIDLPAFPTRPANAQDGLVKMLDYVGKGDAVKIADDIRRKHGAYHSALFEVGIRMYHMPLIYDLDPTLADKVAEFIRSKFVAIGLPDKLWKPTLETVAKRAGFQAVRTAVFQMGDDVFKHLSAVARGQA